MTATGAQTPSQWPAMSMDEVYATLTAPGAPFEMETIEIGGIPTRVYKNAPATLRDVFEGARAWGDRDLFVYEDERVTYEAHYRAATALAHALRDRYGIKKSDRVTLIMRNFPEWSMTFWAVVMLGGVIVPLNAWWTGEELEYGITDSGSSVVIADGERLERLLPHLPNFDLRGFIVTRAGGTVPEGIDRFEDVVSERKKYAEIRDRGMPAADVQPDDDCTIFYTSGTTGRPKGALGSQRNVVTNLVNTSFGTARGLLRRGDEIPTPSPDDPQRASLISVPLFHVTGCHSILVPVVASGAKLVMMYRWNAERALELIERERINSFGGVPAIAWQVLESPNFDQHDLSSVESVSYGGAPAASDLVRRLKEAFPMVQPGQGYGLTETSAITTTNSAEDYEAKPDSAGRPVPVCDVKIMDDGGNEVPVGEVGEIWIKGPNIIKGYWKKPEATAETFTNGWLHSGDLGRVDEDGFVYILDRVKDMLIRGGENIYCVEIEDVLYDHDGVMDAAVVGIPHKVLGEEVGAVVQVAPGHDVSEAELQAWVGKRLANFKVPVKIDLRTEPLERNPNGKILKPPLREFMKQFQRDG